VSEKAIHQTSEISEATRRNIFDSLRLSEITWYGRLDDVQFLERLYDLKEIPSYDSRFSDASGDIWQHRVNNCDWEADWIFDEPRFKLLFSTDDEFLRFLCETAHPVVQADPGDSEKLVSFFNDALAVEGWEIGETTRIAGRPVYRARRTAIANSWGTDEVRSVAEDMSSEYISQQIRRMQSAVDSDPELAIGTAKELVESVCKKILTDEQVADIDRFEFPKLVKRTLKHLDLVPESIHDSAKGARVIRTLLNNLASVSNGMAELRNLYGTGHGKAKQGAGPMSRHAKLAVGAATTLTTFIFETHLDRNKDQSGD